MGLEEDGDDEEEKYNDSTVRLTCGDKDEDIERPPKKARIQRSEKVCLSKDPDQSSGAKQPIISVVLTAHEAIPGAARICVRGRCMPVYGALAVKQQQQELQRRNRCSSKQPEHAAGLGKGEAR
ncbi:ZFAT protein, partial [Polypterus senegalus]